MAGHIFIYGGIGTDEREKEISADYVRDQIKANASESELVVHIISPGGDVFEGEAIYNALKNSGKKITTHIEGTCASIATLIAAAGSTIIMNKTARFMIHNPKISNMQTAADSRDLRHVADQLDQIKTLLINVYESKTSLGKDKLWELYDNETWLTADQAQQMGFIDESVDAIKAVAKINLPKIISEMKDKKATESLFKRFQNWLITNEARETLEDGTVILVMTDDGDWTGKQVSYEDGSPLEPKEYPLAGGRVMVVGEGSVITEVRDAQPAAQAEPPANNDMDKDKEIESLKAQLADALKKAEAATNEATTARVEKMKFENRSKAIEKDFLALKEEAMKTFGDDSPPSKRGPVIVNKHDDQEDPMGDFALTFLKNRNIINDNDND
jgi:ATP-dependent protease ClpP protease subunit